MVVKSTSGQDGKLEFGNIIQINQIRQLELELEAAEVFKKYYEYFKFDCERCGKPIEDLLCKECLQK